MNDDARIASIVALVKARPAHTWTIDSFAREMDLSVSRLARLFVAEVGEPFYHFLIGTRLNEGKRLLRSTDMSVKQIAFAVGMPTEKFCKHFRERFNQTPTEWRNQAHAPMARMAR